MGHNLSLMSLISFKQLIYSSPLPIACLVSDFLSGCVKHKKAHRGKVWFIQI